MQKRTIGFLLIFLPFISVFGQNLQDGQKRWSPERKLQLEDYKIKISDETNHVAYSQFLISHAIGGFDFLKRNLNQKIENIFLGNASWIDTTQTENIQQVIEFQQMFFDLSEIYARKFRKSALENKGQITKGFAIINEINNRIISEFSERRLKMIMETQNGQNQEEFTKWKAIIANELKELHEFRYGNTKRIELE